MAYLNDCTIKINNFTPQRISYQNRFANNTVNNTVSFSSAKNDDNDKKKKNNLIAYITGGIVLLAGIAILIKTRNNKILSAPTKNDGKNITSKAVNNTETSESSQLNKKLAEQQAETAELETKTAELRKNSDNNGTPKSENKHEITPPLPVAQKPQSSQIQSSTIDEQANHAYDMYAQKLAETPELKDKGAIIREVLPDLMALKISDDALKAVLGHIDLQNKDFVVKTAVPTVLRNSETLDLGKAMSATLKAVSPDTIDCLDRLAVNAQKFKIKSQVDSINLLKSLTKENKKFAIEELFPYLAENMDKYKIRQSGIMGKFLEVITPENKDFVLNEALPTLLKNSESLNIDITDALKIAKHLNQNNFKNVQIIADNIENLHLKDADGFLIVDKFVIELEK
jgi:hypothetical protein